MNARMMHLNLFVFGCGHHRGAWRHPHSLVERLGDIRYYEQLAQTAERGKLDAVFFADGHAVGNVADGSSWFLEPLTALAAMSRATERIGLISTVSSTFSTPFHAARQVAGLETRLVNAERALAALTPPRGRGKRQITDKSALVEAIDTVLKTHRVEGLLQIT